MNEKPLKLALHGMDARAIKLMMLFLSGPCKGAATLVINTEDADVDIFDVDVLASKSLFQTHIKKGAQKPVIVFSILDVTHEGVLSLKKPINADEMLRGLAEARKQTKQTAANATTTGTITAPEATEEEIQSLFNIKIERSEPAEVALAVSVQQAQLAQQEQQEQVKTILEEPGQWVLTPEQPELLPPELAGLAQVEDNISASAAAPGPNLEPVQTEQEVLESEVQTLKAFVRDYSERDKTAKHQTAMRLDEASFNYYIGSALDVDVNNPKEFKKAYYDATNYYQGIVQSAIASCRGKNQIFSLASNRKKIVLFPGNQEIWVDGNDTELKLLAGVKLIHRKAKSEEGLRLDVVDPRSINFANVLSQFQNLEAFIWKLACWTSMGRYPKAIDHTKPVYLKNWPNFTRLLVTPHALRIAALLVEQPRTMPEIAQKLNIKPQYVFIFISAAHAIGLAGQARRVSDTLVEAMTKVRSVERVWLLGSIMKKLNNLK